LVQWDTSTHDWLEGRGETIYLISMIDDATSRLFARFVRHDTSEENMRLLWAYLERFGRPLAFYTDKAGMFKVSVKTKRQETREGRDRPPMPPGRRRSLGGAVLLFDSRLLSAGERTVHRRRSAQQSAVVCFFRKAAKTSRWRTGFSLLLWCGRRRFPLRQQGAATCYRQP
jgi:hypothetical protein